MATSGSVSRSLILNHDFVFFVRPYPCEAISIISVVLFKTSSADPGEREKAAQLLHLLER